MTILPSLVYFVCATPRSGSSLLCTSLAATGVAGKPEEYFERLRHSGLPREPREYFDGADGDVVGLLPETRTGDPAGTDLECELPRYLAEGTTPNGVFGAKLMWSYFGDLLARLGTTPGGRALAAIEERFGSSLRWVHVTRRDKVEQAVSLWRAVQTRAWRASDEVCAEPVYDARGIRHLHRQLHAHEQAWRDWFADNRIAPLHVEYETFIAEHERTIRRVLHHLGVSVTHIPDPPLSRQGDDRSARWVARFREAA
ncbi:MAG TPA: Stf0 family sulfotransferase [Solirubrobacteraceae bacterium]|nr:Stf0 family sulfotransferase [Solirubrobacteraceae bacterium]